MHPNSQNGRFRQEEPLSNPASPSMQHHDETLHPYYLDKEPVKQHGVLNRTFSSLNPFKVEGFNGTDFNANLKKLFL